MYTVKQLADLAGITVRTLHHYDQIDLLKPSQTGSNGYRYYDDEAVARLQQILLFRETGMELAQIRDVLDDPGFDALTALLAHRRVLEQRVERMFRLIETVDTTIAHIQKGIPMSDKKKMFGGLNQQQQDDYTREARLQYDPDMVNESVKRWNDYGKEKQQAIIDEGNTIYEAIAQAVADGKPVEDEAMQTLMQRWHDHLRYFYEPTTEILRGLADMYIHAPDFRQKFDALHPDMAETMQQAVAVYVDALETAELERLIAEDEANEGKA